MSTADAPPLPRAAASRRPRRLWFPLLWVLLVIGGGGLFQFSDATQDYKNSLLMFSVPVTLLGLTLWAVLLSGLSGKVRWALGLAPWVVIGLLMSSVELVNNGDMGFVAWRWRWAPKPDEKLEQPTATLAINDWAPTPQDYPRFLGNGYWAEVAGVELQTDWQAHPPTELWRKEIGAGWSGFAIVGRHAVTQEQRGPNELVTCYEVQTGKIVWTHGDAVRFDPGGGGALGGVGPRATPTIYEGKVYTQGATGILNCLDARNGELVWSHDTLAENQTANVLWGKAGSPLIVEREGASEMVVVSVGADGGRSLAAYDVETGKIIWSAGDRRSAYASPVLADLAGLEQILVINEEFVTAHRASDGAVLWEHPWPGNSDANASIPQPIPLTGDRVFLSKGYGVGAALLQLSADDTGGVRAESIWQKTVMKTKMCNVAIRDGYVYGLDGGILQCIDLETGKSQWKKRRRPAIGHGQNILVGHVLLLLSESGELILVEALPEKYRELAAIRVFPEEQVTWNTPAFAPPYLLVRNSLEVACYRLSSSSRDVVNKPIFQDNVRHVGSTQQIGP